MIVTLDRYDLPCYNGGTQLKGFHMMDRTGLPSNGMREVRVTARRGTPRDFIAPELSPVSTHNVEMDKGTRGFTDMDTKVVTVVTTPAQEKAKRDMRNVKDMTVGTRVIRHKVSAKPVVKTTGPSDRYREARLRAAQLAALEGTLDEW